ARASDLQEAWRRLGLTRVPLDVISCPDRRITRAAVELVADELADGDTEITVLLPRIEHERAWHRLLHDRTSNRIAEAMADLPHANVTFVPYHLGRKRSLIPIIEPDLRNGKGKAKHRPTKGGDEASSMPDMPPGAVRPGEAKYRQRVTVAGRVFSVRVQPRAGAPSLECTLKDSTGQIVLVF